METFHSNQTCILWQLHLKIPPMWAGKEKASAEREESVLVEFRKEKDNKESR